MRKSIISFVLLWTTCVAHAQDVWTTKDTLAQVAVTTTLLMDWHQTRQIAAQPNKYYEMNPVLGSHPSTDKVNAYFAGAIVGSAIVAYLLPSPWRQGLQYGTIAVELVVIGRNKSIGLRLAL